MKAGKLPAGILKKMILHHQGVQRPDVLLGPAVGEDAAVLDFGDEVCVIASDPITGAFSGVGRLAVHVAANDVAATGAQPVGIQVVLLWPPEDGVEARLEAVMAEISETAQTLGMAVLGGHTEITSRVDEGVVVTTCIGRAPRQAYVPSGGGKPGDDIMLVRAAGLEGTGILASDHAHRLAGLPPGVVDRARTFLDEISVVEPALAARGMGVTAMHDVTEGGVLGAVWEMAHAAGAGARIERAKVPVRPETAQICQYLGLDPLGLLGSGALLLAAPAEANLPASLRRQGHEVAVIGQLLGPGEPVLLIENDGSARAIHDCPEDELWRWLGS